jgi:hypothetical protein
MKNNETAEAIFIETIESSHEDSLVYQTNASSQL